MRQIKFRARVNENDKHFEKGEWVYGHYYYDFANKNGMMVTRVSVGSVGLGSGLVEAHIPVDDKTRGQFTGLLDKQNEEIYEGDIIEAKYPDCETGEKTYVVVYEKGMFKTKKDWNDGHYCIGDGYIEGCVEGKCMIKIIGNIYENKDLLK